MNKPLTLGMITAAALLVSAALIVQKELSSSSSEAVDSQALQRASAERQPASERTSRVRLALNQETASKDQAKGDKNPSTHEERGPAYQSLPQLVEYADIRSKVFPSTEERQRQQVLLRDPQVIAELGRILIQPSGGINQKHADQGAAVDLLIDALKAGDPSGNTTSTLAKIVSDPQVEDLSLPLEARREIAGFKAEILYHWSALKPHEAGQISTLLPGPVSQEIWTNVQRAMENNQRESMATAQN